MFPTNRFKRDVDARLGFTLFDGLRIRLTIQRRSLLLLPLVFAAAFAYVSAFLLRFEFVIPVSVEKLFLGGLCIFIPVKGIVFWMFRLHMSSWRLVSVFDLSRVVVANIVASTAAFVVTALVAGRAFPHSIYAIDAALCLLATAGIQCSVRLYREVFFPDAPERDSRAILIYGAGAAGLMLAREFRSNVSLGTRVVGFLDDDESKRDSSLAGIPILGRGSDAAQLVARFAQQRRPVSEIIIAIPAATAPQMRVAVSNCGAAGIPFKTLPGMSALLDGRISPQIREVSANDLLGREPVHIDESSIERTVAGHSVLVTGGCGSIGSELCRQIARFSPQKLVIFDQAESEMFMLALDLRKKFPDLNLATEIGDIFRPSRVKQAMSQHDIDIVFHAAAYKHVPLMEANIREAIENNVIGTYNVARAAHWQGVKKFVLISSDKAVNPTSIMGVTKRIAEMVVSAMPLNGGPNPGAFVSVRFGNVLGSAGSVIPVFQRQIASGGPVTVTHPEMRRYFMSISEAVQLVLQASTMAQGSEVFVLDMGEQVRIIDLAHNMVRLAGLTPDKDIEIRVVGLRPGEKLFEELRLDDEKLLPTPHEKIRRFRSGAPDPQYVGRWLERLRILLMEANSAALKAHLLVLVPEYQGLRAAMSESGGEQLRVRKAHAS
jgi:FlaA1/EpsC-like NDP-sugar epimerase